MPVPPPTVHEVGPIVTATFEGLRAVATIGILTSMALYGFIWKLVEYIGQPCPNCGYTSGSRQRGKKHGSSPEAHRERLFGRQVVVGDEEEEPAQEAEPSGGEQRDEGRPEDQG